jgi:hypothetical protein
MKRARTRFQLNVFGILFTALGLLLTVLAAGEFFGSHPHGWRNFYQLAPVAVLLLVAGVSAFIRKKEN